VTRLLQAGEVRIRLGKPSADPVQGRDMIRLGEPWTTATHADLRCDGRATTCQKLPGGRESRSHGGLWREQREANLEGTCVRKGSLPTGWRACESHGPGRMPGAPRHNERGLTSAGLFGSICEPEGELLSVTRRTAVRSWWHEAHHLEANGNRHRPAQVPEAAVAGAVTKVTAWYVGRKK